MLPSPSNINFTVKNEGYSGALLEITEPTVPNNCNNISFPPTQYEVHFRKKGSEKLKNVISVTRLIHVENNVLDKETECATVRVLCWLDIAFSYEVSVSWFNRYYPSQDSSAPKSLRTGYGFPTAPRDPAGYALTPDTVLLYWKLPETLNAPADEIRYRVRRYNRLLVQAVDLDNPTKHWSCRSGADWRETVCQRELRLRSFRPDRLLGKSLSCEDCQLASVHRIQILGTEAEKNCCTRVAFR